MASTLAIGKALHHMVTHGLTTQRFTLRPFQRADLEAFTAYRAEPKVAKYQSWTDYSYSDAVALFENMDYAQFGAADTWFQLAIVTAASAATPATLVGDLALHFIDEQQMEIGFTIAPEYQGQQLPKKSVDPTPLQEQECTLNLLHDHRLLKHLMANLMMFPEDFLAWCNQVLQNGY